jgi:hypothetical protein
MAPMWHAGLPYGTQGFHMAPIWCQQLPYSACGSIRCTQLTDQPHSWHQFGSHMVQNGSHMAHTQLPYGKQTAPIWQTNSSHMAPIWCIQLLHVTICLQHGAKWLPLAIHLPYSAHGSHMACRWCMATSTSHTAYTASIWLPHDAPLLLYVTYSSHMAPSTSYLAPYGCHMGTWLPYSSYIKCTPLPSGKHTAPIWHKWLPYGPHMVHSAPICSPLPPTWSQMAPIRLTRLSYVLNIIYRVCKCSFLSRHKHVNQ